MSKGDQLDRGRIQPCSMVMKNLAVPLVALVILIVLVILIILDTSSTSNTNNTSNTRIRRFLSMETPGFALEIQNVKTM
jgi:hypothetical protein